MSRPDTFSHAEFLKRYGPLGKETFSSRGDGSSNIHRPFKGGYQIQNASGLLLQFNARMKDEIYIQPGIGILNITLARHYLRDLGKKAQVQRIEIDDALLVHISSTQFEESVVTAMTQKRRDEPILLLMRGPGIDMIDGHHRIQRRIRDGLTFVDTITLAESTIPLILVEVYARHGDEWRKFDATESAMGQARQIIIPRSAR